MNCFLIDFENVNADSIKDLSGVQKGDALVVFYSENHKSITLDILNSVLELKLKYSGFKVKVGTKNALDFQLVSYLGYLIGQGSSDTNYHIVSEDKGFTAAADFWMEQGISVDCVSLREPAIPVKDIKQQKPKKKKISSENLATLDEIKALIAKNNEPDVVMEIFNQYKTRQAICNGLAKHFKDTKRAGDIYKQLKPLLKAKNKS